MLKAPNHGLNRTVIRYGCQLFFRLPGGAPEGLIDPGFPFNPRPLTNLEVAERAPSVDLRERPIWLCHLNQLESDLSTMPNDNRS